jgi:cysteinyl-tRNA synthetase
MSKSAGNFQRITELEGDGIDPLAFRYLCLTARYARKVSFSDASLAAAAAGLESFRAGLRELGSPPSAGPWTPAPPLVAGRSADRPVGRADGPAGHGGEDGPQRLPPGDRAHSPAGPLSAAGRSLHERFVTAIDDDLDFPAALRVAREALRAPLAREERRWLLLDWDAVLGLDLHRVWEGGRAALPAGAAPLMAARSAARAGRDFGEADRLRDELRRLGVEPIDRPDGSSDWQPAAQSDGGETARSSRVRNRSRTR